MVIQIFSMILLHIMKDHIITHIKKKSCLYEENRARCTQLKFALMMTQRFRKLINLQEIGLFLIVL